MDVIIPPLPPDRVKYEKNKLITKCYGKNLKSYFKVPEIRGEIQVGGRAKIIFRRKIGNIHIQKIENVPPPPNGNPATALVGPYRILNNLW